MGEKGANLLGAAILCGLSAWGAHAGWGFWSYFFAFFAGCFHGINVGKYPVKLGEG